MTRARDCPLDFIPGVDRKLDNQENAIIKTTLDLPDALVKQLRAVREGRQLKDEVADLLRKGLAAPADEEPNNQLASVGSDEKTGLPLIECRHAASQDAVLTPERVADLLLAQEVVWHHDAGR
jgi:plasmid stability protein